MVSFNLTANTQAEISVTLPHSYNSGTAYAAVVDFEYYSSADLIKHIIRSKTATGFVVRVIASTNATDGKMQWITKRLTT